MIPVPIWARGGNHAAVETFEGVSFNTALAIINRFYVLVLTVNHQLPRGDRACEVRSSASPFLAKS
jgi:hypothetical protein